MLAIDRMLLGMFACLFCVGCGIVSYHDKVGWRAEDYFDDPKVVALCKAIEADDLDAMQAALEEHFADLASWQVPQGGLFFWLTLNHKLDTRTLLQPAMAQNVAFMPGEPFFVDPDANPGYLRLNFSHVPPEKLGEGLRRLAAVIREAYGALEAQRSE